MNKPNLKRDFEEHQDLLNSLIDSRYIAQDINNDIVMFLLDMAIFELVENKEGLPKDNPRRPYKNILKTLTEIKNS